jgi:hypothetical protein
MSPYRLRKIALYLEYIAFVMRKEADDAEPRTVRPGRPEAGQAVPAGLAAGVPVAPAEVPSQGDEGGPA